MYTLHITNKTYSSWSLWPWWLMRTLEIPFQEKLTPFPENANGASFKAVSPSGKVPCLVDGTLAVWDALAIVEYLAERDPGVWPADIRARAWARSAAAEMHSGFSALRSQCSMHCGVRIRLHQISPALQRDLGRLGELWQDGLSRFGGPFLAGATPSAVDAFYAPVAFRVQTYGLPLEPAAAAYAQLLLDQPATRQWQQEALGEPWREPDLERGVLAAGQLLADLRNPPR